jgi:hypothetical protein
VGEDVRVDERELLAVGSAVGVHKLKAEVIEKDIAHVQTMLIGDGVGGFGVQYNAVDVSAVNLLIHGYQFLSHLMYSL